MILEANDALENKVDCDNDVVGFEGGDDIQRKASKSWARQPKTESQRNKREAKKLQKYDSNSIDEEEFQDCKLMNFW